MQNYFSKGHYTFCISLNHMKLLIFFFYHLTYKSCNFIVQSNSLKKSLSSIGKEKPNHFGIYFSPLCWFVARIYGVCADDKTWNKMISQNLSENTHIQDFQDVPPNTRSICHWQNVLLHIFLWSIPSFFSVLISYIIFCVPSFCQTPSLGNHLLEEINSHIPLYFGTCDLWEASGAVFCYPIFFVTFPGANMCKVIRIFLVWHIYWSKLIALCC